MKEPLFIEKIEAWISGPIIKELYEFLFPIGRNLITKSDFDCFDNSSLEKEENIKIKKQMIKEIVHVYTHTPLKTDLDIRNILRYERPWNDARKGLLDSERGSNEISHQSLIDFYSRFYS
jgi:uncharacterized phage-associated protein